MLSTTVTSKGQVTVPKAIREDLKLTPGTRLHFHKLPNGEYRLHARTVSITDTFGMLDDLASPFGRSLTVEEDELMAQAIADHVLEQDER
ncbi:MAG: AbrB/MazE/SpoVT family DNA-binding domain-containing protein [Nesterenkonia sp.]